MREWPGRPYPLGPTCDDVSPPLKVEGGAKYDLRDRALAVFRRASRAEAGAS